MSTEIRDNGRQAVIAVVQREGKFLVIKRSQFESAPGKFCFPGGGVEPGESFPAALARELEEEVNIRDATAIREVWQSRSPAGTLLSWWLAEIPAEAQPVANPQEVASIQWWDEVTMDDCPELLQTNRLFLAALQAGEFTL